MCTGGQAEREERVALEISEELVRSMEPGAVFRDYVSSETERVVFVDSL